MNYHETLDKNILKKRPHNLKIAINLLKLVEKELEAYPDLQHMVKVLGRQVEEEGRHKHGTVRG